MLFRYAEQVSSGDEILVQINGKLAPARIIAISLVSMQGRYHSSLIIYIIYMYVQVYLWNFSGDLK